MWGENTNFSSRLKLIKEGYSTEWLYMSKPKSKPVNAQGYKKSNAKKDQSQRAN